MLSIFLDETTIHGLRYLVASRSGLSRLAWLACILTSATCAAVIIYFNVVNWDNSPAVITSVEPTHMIKGRPLMPTVTVCPRNFNYANLVSRLLTAHPELAGEHPDALRSDVLRHLLYFRWMDNLNLLKSTMNDKDIFDPCNNGTDLLVDDEGDRGEVCRFVGLVYALADVVAEHPLREYLVETAAKGSQPTADGLEAWVEAYRGRPLEDERRRPPPDTWHYGTAWTNVLEFYSQFFAVRDPSGRLEPLKDLDSYTNPTYPPASAGKLGRLLAYLSDMGARKPSRSKFINYGKIATTSMKDAMSGHLGVAADEFDALLNGFSADPANRPAFVTKESGETLWSEVVFVKTDNTSCVDHLAADGGKTNMVAFCAENTPTDDDDDARCAKYCRDVVLNRRLQARAAELFQMATDATGPLAGGGGAPSSLLYGCRRRESGWHDDCWRRVVTDVGPCFATKSDASLAVVHEVSDSDGLSFPLDTGGVFEYSGYSITDRRYDVYLTPPGHHVFGPEAEDADATFLFVHPTEQVGRALQVQHLAVGVKYVTEGTPEFRVMRPGKRGCLYPDEHPLDIYETYSEPNCVLECAFNQAISTCSCVPWYLAEHYPGSTICELHGNACFRHVVGNRYKGRPYPCKHQCLPDCEKTEYEILRTPTTEATEEDEDFYKFILDQKKNSVPEDLREELNLIRLNTTLEHVRIIDVWMGKKTTLRCSKTATVTVVDMISNIGGTLGLFCGMSILSAVEIVYWAGSLINKKRL